jgi:hypothetical protein
MLPGYTIQPPTESFRKFNRPSDRDTLFLALHSPGFAVPTLPAKDAAWYKPTHTLRQSRPKQPVGTGTATPLGSTIPLGANVGSAIDGLVDPVVDPIQGVPPKSLFYSPRVTYTFDFTAPYECPTNGCRSDDDQAHIQGQQAWQHDYQQTMTRVRAQAVRSDAVDLGAQHFGQGTYRFARADSHGATALPRNGGDGDVCALPVLSDAGQRQLRGAIQMQTNLQPFIRESADEIQLGNVNMAPLGMATPSLDLEPPGWKTTRLLEALAGIQGQERLVQAAMAQDNALAAAGNVEAVLAPRATAQTLRDDALGNVANGLNGIDVPMRADDTDADDPSRPKTPMEMVRTWWRLLALVLTPVVVLLLLLSMSD